MRPGQLPNKGTGRETCLSHWRLTFSGGLYWFSSGSHKEKWNATLDLTGVVLMMRSENWMLWMEISHERFLCHGERNGARYCHALTVKILSFALAAAALDWWTNKRRNPFTERQLGCRQWHICVVFYLIYMQPKVHPNHAHNARQQKTSEN